MQVSKPPPVRRRCVCGRVWTGAGDECPICRVYREFDDQVHAKYAAAGFVDYHGSGTVQREVAAPDCEEPTCDNVAERRTDGTYQRWCSTLCRGMGQRGKVRGGRPTCNRPGCEEPAQKLLNPTRWGERCSRHCQQESARQPVPVQEVQPVSSNIPRCEARDCDKPSRINTRTKQPARYCSTGCNWRENDAKKRDAKAASSRPSPKPKRQLAPEPEAEAPPELTVVPTSSSTELIALPDPAPQAVNVEEAVAPVAGFLCDIHKALALMPGIASVSVTVTVLRDGRVVITPPQFRGEERR